MYRIISGNLKGKRISAPKNFDVRPTTDFAKEGLFNILKNRYNLHDVDVLDLYAGIGSISFEFCSAGVPKVVAVDKNFKHCAFIEKEAVQLDVENQLEVVCKPVDAYINQCSERFDIIFADPPFNTELNEYENLVNSIQTKNLLSDGGVLVVEHQSRLNLDEISGFQEKRKYGNVSFSFFS